jgi:hypothetical protein
VLDGHGPEQGGQVVLQRVLQPAQVLTGIVEVAHATVDDLDEACVSGVPGEKDVSPRAVPDRYLVEQGGGFGPPPVLFRTSFVGTRRLLGVEPGARR